MIIFKTFLRVLNRNKVMVILYTVLLVGFAVSNMQTGDSSTDFTASQPDIYIVNRDEEGSIAKGLSDYMESTCQLVDLKEDEDAISDALFYRDVNYIIYIPEHFSEDFLRGREPAIEVRSTGDYQASYAEMLLSRYLKVAGTYLKFTDNAQEIVDQTAGTLAKKTKVEVASKLDTAGLTKAAYYYNFASYSLLAGCVLVICLILSSFQAETIRKRTIVSSVNERKFNGQLMLSNGLFALMLWLLYVFLSIILFGEVMMTAQGLLFMVNSLVFTFCALTIAFLIGNLVHSKNAINGIVNVVALGSSFLCGAFIPVEWLPDSVLTVAHILPAYWYVQTNELLKTMESVSLETLKPMLFNTGMLLAFSALFMVIANIVSRKKRKIG